MLLIQRWFIIALIFLSQSLTAQVKTNTRISAELQSIPILIGSAYNPVLKLNISVPAEQQKFSLKKISGQINQWKNVEDVDIFITGAEHFSGVNRIASFKPSLQHFSIPVELDLKAGVHFVWFSIQLKPGTPLNSTIQISCDVIESNNGTKISVKQPVQKVSNYTGIIVRKAGEDKVHTYRIPGIIQTNKGTLISVYDIRYKHAGDLPANIDVGMSRSTNKGRSWESMKVIMDMGEPHESNGVGDPAILFDAQTNRIWVAALWSKGNRSIAGSKPGLSPDTTGQFVLVYSDDDGITWSKPQSITEQVKDPKWHLFFNGPGSGIVMKDGKLVFAAQYWDENKMPFSTIIYSDDHGKTWKGNIAGPKSNTTESQVVETLPGVLMLNMRDNRGGYRSVATTRDMGKTWIEHARSFNALKDPVCMASLISSHVSRNGKKQDILFFSNPNTSSGRYDISIRASKDLGESWDVKNTVLVDSRNSYGYSSLVRIDDKHIGILYEGTGDLYFVVVPISDILKN